MDTSIVAQYRPRMDVPQAENSTTPAAGGVTAQFSPHSLASSDIGQPLPVVVGTHLTEGERLPPAVSHDAQIAMPPASLVTGQFPVRSASYSESGAAGSEAKVRGNNWHPQGAGSPSLGTPDSVPQTPSSQEPPLWRARESQR